jgi:tellurite resistance protein
MSLAPETEWTIVVCGLIAHADGVLDGEECERLLSFVDETIDADAYSEWLAIVGDRGALEARLAAMTPPPPTAHRELLEQAWSMAMVDGTRCEAEIEKLQEIALAIGVEPMQLEFWRDAWAQADEEFSEVTAAAAAAVLGGPDPVSPGDAGLFSDLVARLPTTDEHRAQVRPYADVGGDVVTVGLRLTSLPRKVRTRALRLVARVAADAADAAAVQHRFVDLAVGSGVPAADAAQMLQQR